MEVVEKIERIREEVENLLERNLHVRDVQREINKLRTEIIELSSRLSDVQFYMLMTELDNLERELYENYHDFSDKFKTITLRKPEHIYYH